MQGKKRNSPAKLGDPAAKTSLPEAMFSICSAQADAERVAASSACQPALLIFSFRPFDSRTQPFAAALAQNLAHLVDIHNRRTMNRTNLRGSRVSASCLIVSRSIRFLDPHGCRNSSPRLQSTRSHRHSRKSLSPRWEPRAVWDTPCAPCTRAQRRQHRLQLLVGHQRFARGNSLLHAQQCGPSAVRFNWLRKIVEGMDIESLHCIVIVRCNKDSDGHLRCANLLDHVEPLLPGISISRKRTSCRFCLRAATTSLPLRHSPAISNSRRLASSNPQPLAREGFIVGNQRAQPHSPRS